MWLLLSAIAALAASSAVAQERDGEGRVSLSAGGLWTLNTPFAQDARNNGYEVSAPYSFGPFFLGTFGYWVDEHFELSVEGDYHHAGLGIRGQSSLSVDAETVMATVRWIFVTGYQLWPYLGGSFGLAINSVSSPLNIAWGGCSTACNDWNAVGYGEALEFGAGWDLSTHFGVTAELRYTFDVLQSPLSAAINAGGLSLMVGVYLRIPRSSNDVTLPASPQ